MPNFLPVEDWCDNRDRNIRDKNTEYESSKADCYLHYEIHPFSFLSVVVKFIHCVLCNVYVYDVR